MADVSRLNRITLFFTILALLGLVWCAFSWLNARGMFAIQSVEIVSRPVNVDVGLLESAIRNDVRGTFFSASPQQVRAILKRIPWVRDAVVERRWPMSLRVSIVEYRPAGYWGDGDLISDQGDIFKAPLVAPLPRFDGPMSMSVETLQRYRDIKRVVAAYGLDVKAVTVSLRGGLSVTLSDHTIVEFGREQFDLRLARLVGLYSSWSGSERDQLGRIDLRYKSAAAIAPRDPSMLRSSKGLIAAVGMQ